MDKTRRLLLALTATAIAAIDGVTVVAARDPDDPRVTEAVLAILQESSALSRQEIGNHEGLKGVTSVSIDEALNTLIYQGRIRRRGLGTRGSPYLYEENVTGHH